MKRSKRASARAASSLSLRSAPRSAPLAARETPLQWLRRRKDKNGRPLLTETQFQAGEKLAQDYRHAGLQPRVTANWSALAPGQRTRRSAPGAGVEMRDAVVAARQRVNRALTKLAYNVDISGHLGPTGYVDATRLLPDQPKTPAIAAAADELSCSKRWP